LREAVEQAVLAVRALLDAPTLPPPANDARCRHCSLIELCQPGVVAAKVRYRALLDELESE
jgi:CRISPR-associated exonuclease Cas4